MPNYNKSIIYQIKCLETREVYIGSSCTSINYRMAKHKNSNNKCCSKQIIERGNYKVDILLYCSCKNKKELCTIEGNFINREPNCINIKYPIRTTEERKEYCRNYQINNSKKLKIQRNKCREKRKDKAKVEGKRWREWKNSWGGDIRYQNNLLLINI